MSDAWSKNGNDRRRVSGHVKARREPCCICSEPIDYTLRWPNPRSFSVQHVISRSVKPSLMFDVTNCKAAHLDCNQSQGTEPMITERVTSRKW